MRSVQSTPAERRLAAIVLHSSLRSLNVTQAAGMVLGEALRQLDAFPTTKRAQESQA